MPQDPRDTRWHARCIVHVMDVASSQHSTLPHTWTGLLLDSMKRPADIAAIRQILGENAQVIVVRESDLPSHTLRCLLQTGATNILASSSNIGAVVLMPLLKAASAFGSIRRVVLLHDMDVDSIATLEHTGILLLRDCQEVRASLCSLVESESATPAARSATTALNPLFKEPSDAYRFPAAST